MGKFWMCAFVLSTLPFALVIVWLRAVWSMSLSMERAIQRRLNKIDIPHV